MRLRAKARSFLKRLRLEASLTLRDRSFLVLAARALTFFEGPQGPSRSPPRDWAAISDAELGQALLQGEPGAQHAAWQRFLPVVRAMVRRRLGGSADVEDVVQDAFIALFSSVTLLREPGALRAFALTITVRVLNREAHRRSRASIVALDGDAGLEELACEEADPATRHAYSALQTLVNRLRARERRAFTLRFVGGLNAPEVATALGVSVPTVRRVLSSAAQRVNSWASRDPFLADYLPR
ncbi:MAG: sigma-70 family RNA polymerase sigma factor [Myxococcales bacterium]|nr:MAG: sigma-70 family RNA polymerase sigma factor [Myxococcales bacterium]